MAIIIGLIIGTATSVVYALSGLWDRRPVLHFISSAVVAVLLTYLTLWALDLG